VKHPSKTFRLVSLGCAKNLVDSEVMLGILQERGWTPISEEEADVVIINTCGFIRAAQEESIDAILAATAAKERGRCGRVVVAGCLPQLFNRDLAAALPEADLFVGTGEFHRIADLLEGCGTKRARKVFVRPPRYLYDHRTPRVLTSQPGSAYIKIAEGCSNRCAYCMIPRIRGRLRSRTIPSILLEARAAVGSGTKEINLIAQDTTAYGKDRGKADLVPLLRRLARVEGLAWIRLLYAHPAHLTPELIRLIRDEGKICRYLDLPLQHIDDRVLQAMNRPVSGALVRDLLNRLREEVPDISLRTSLMVGFPGESERSFARLLDFVSETRFDHLGVFRYSPEEGTPAAAMKRQVPEAVKEERYHRIMALQKEISREKQKQFLEKNLSVLIERRGQSADILWEGRSERQAPEVDGLVFMTKGKARPGEMVEVKIRKAGVYDLYGEILRILPN
jgi:ribosomal protein S12 methylthiotransferase